MKFLNKKSLRIISMTICLLLVFGSMPQNNTIVYAETIMETMQRLEKEKQEKEKDISANKNDAKKASQLKANYAQKAEIERQQLELLAAAILESEGALNVKQEEIVNKIIEFENTKKLFEDRLVAMYKKQDRSVIAAVLSVENFSSLLRLSKNLKLIAKTDNELMDLLQNQQAELEVLKAEIERQLAELNEKKLQAEELRKQYEASMLAAQAKENKALAEQKANEAAYGDISEKLEAARIEWEKWVAEEIQGGDFVGGEFMWPVPTSKKITSDFGIVRVINGKKDVHRGIDIGAPLGTPIYAAADGTASTTGMHYSYGTCVKLSHGGGVVSIYAHMSAIAAGITTGKIVRKGDLIGYIGSTGVSTGNHLHFEIDVNGKPVNPYGYLGK